MSPSAENGGPRVRSPRGSNGSAKSAVAAAAGAAKAAAAAAAEDDERAALLSSSSPPLADDSVPHPHAGLCKAAPPAALDQPFTAAVAHRTPRGSVLRRVAVRMLEMDTRASAKLHRASWFPFDLLLVPFAMACGSYGMPVVIPLVALGESPRLAAVLLAATLLTLLCTTAGKRLTKRMRPTPASLARKFFDLRRFERNFSFPSGDSAQGAVVALSLAFYAAALQEASGAAASPSAMSPYCFLLLAPLVMTARVYFGAHWWSDTVGGALCGGLAASGCWALLPKLMGWHIGAAGADSPLLPITPLFHWLGFRAE